MWRDFIEVVHAATVTVIDVLDLAGRRRKLVKQFTVELRKLNDTRAASTLSRRTQRPGRKNSSCA